MEAIERHNGLTTNKLKIIAAIAMFCDHFVSVFLPHDELISLLFRLLGRTAAPVFCFFIAQGFYYTRDRRKYIIRLLVLALISHIPYNLSFGYTFFQATSVIWPLALGLVALTAFKSEKIHLVLKLAIVAVCCALAYRANWNFVAVLWILMFGIFHGDLKRQIAAFCTIGVVFHLIPVFYRFGFFHDRFPQWFQLGIFLTIPLLLMFNGNMGKKSKFMAWFFYVFYPGHLLLLYLLNRFTPLAEVLGRLL
ncbi:MAG: conjugal transfer protein TraX [Treponema sp.]|nr:conjugal transfer protein TraX [Treponema sp.]